MNSKSVVGVVHREVYTYPRRETLFRPSSAYPEYPFQELSDKTNEVYDMVREVFHLLGLDEEHYGSSDWNPLGGLIQPGTSVLIKPNCVMESNHIKENGTDCLYTNPSVVAAVIDYVCIALAGKGKIVIGDAPMQECRFDVLLEDSGYQKLIEWYRSQGINIDIVDFRELSSEVKNGLHIQHTSDVASGRIIDLGKDSEFYNEAHSENYRITNYDPAILNRNHTDTKNEYYVSDYVLDADVIINIPKPKSHRKAGATIALKNFVGINVRKEYLPHHKLGSKAEGGDEYLKKDAVHHLQSFYLDKMNSMQFNGKKGTARLLRVIFRTLRCLPHKDKYSEGSWYGNETISKTICDLNKIVYFADKQGIMQNTKQRKILIVADMIVSGEKEGPVAPTAKNVGVIAAGTDQVCFDEAVSRLMGFDSNKIPTLVNARNTKGQFRICDNTEPVIASNDPRWDQKKPNEVLFDESLKFEATSGWKGHIEI